MAFLIPGASERRSVGRFYLASFLAEAAHLAMPFQVLVMIRYAGPVQLGLFLGVERAVALAMELPTGAWADRFGRKRCVLAGHLVGALGWLLIPPATLLPPGVRTAAFALAFGLLGFGSALNSGAFEAWVVDNLRAARLRALTLTYFGRERSIASAGGILADLLAFALASAIDLRLFWIVSSVGEVVAAGILWNIPEHEAVDDGREDREGAGVAVLAGEEEAPTSATPSAGTREQREDDAENDEDEDAEDGLTSWEALKTGIAIIRARPALLGFVLMVVWIALTTGTWHEAFQAALAQAGLPERGFAAVELGVDLLGAVTPLLVVGLARRVGAPALLVGAIVVPSVAALSLWSGRPAGFIAALYLFVTAADDLFDPVADEYEHRLIPSSTRAVTASAINLLSSGAALVSTGLLALLLHALPAARAVTVMGVLTLPAILFLIRTSKLRTEDLP